MASHLDDSTIYIHHFETLKSNNENTLLFAMNIYHGMEINLKVFGRFSLKE
jgi:hypothetical protein